jgi:hypothetical protein
MKLRTMRAIVVTLMSVLSMCWGQVSVLESTATGIVLGPSGGPIEDVLVVGFHHNQAGGYEIKSVRTDAAGRFELTDVGPVVSFRATGFKPETRVIRSMGSIQISLREAAGSQWNVLSCSPAQPGHKILGSALRVSFPKGTKSKRSVGDDTSEDIVPFPHDPTQQLYIWEGPGNYNPKPLLLSAFAREKWILEASAISERVLVNDNKVLAIEAVGRDESGNRWRWIQHQTGIIYYHGVHDDAASFFDSALASICVER